MTVSTLLDFLKDKDPDTPVYIARDSTDFLSPVSKVMDGAITDYTDTTRDVVINVIYLEGFDNDETEEEE